MTAEPENIDSYIAIFPPDVQKRMNMIYTCVREKAPEAEESISYGMPAFKLNGRPLIYFAAYKNHIGVYATPTGHAAFAGELAAYKQGKGSVQFPNNQSFPMDLIARIIQFRVTENETHKPI